MAQWVTFDYMGLKRQYNDRKINNDDKPVNLDFVATFYRTEAAIVFVVPDSDNIRWDYLHDEVRDKQYSSLMGMISSSDN